MYDLSEAAWVKGMGVREEIAGSIGTTGNLLSMPETGNMC